MTNSDSREFLSPMQRRLVSIALVLLALNLIGAFLFGIFMLLQWIVVYFADVLWPLAVAGILALMLKPMVLWAEKTLRIGRVGAIILLYGLVVIFSLILAALILPVIFIQARAFLDYLPTLLNQTTALLTRFFPEAAEWLTDALNPDALREHLKTLSVHFRKIMESSLPALNTLGDYLARVFTMIAGFVIIPIYLFFFLLTDKNPLRSMDDQLSFIPERYREDMTFLAGEFARIIVAFFRGQIVIGLIMGVLLAIGFTVAGLKFGAFLGIIIGLLNIIPYLGSTLGLLTVLPLSFLQQEGGFVLLLLVLGVFAMVQLIEGYLLTPKIMGRSTGLHPLAIIIAIFFWGKALGGILGMILAIPLTAFFVVVWRLVRKKYLEYESKGQEADKEYSPISQ
ncbi:MAG: AI-2E family transporter [Desulfobacteraceae bacterium]|nr:MAG: AI-2E family transporter [Desulfobacteraceae bacterium]